MPRYFERITKEELKTKIEAALASVRYGRGSDGHNIPFMTEQVNKDLFSKCEFDIENVYGYKEEDASWSTIRDITEFHTWENGLTTLGVLAGGDWESPVYFIIYWDGQQLRGYLPKKGNPYNHKMKQAFGNHTEEDRIACKKQYPERFKDFELEDIYPPDHLEGMRDLNLIKEDILERLKER